MIAEHEDKITLDKGSSMLSELFSASPLQNLERGEILPKFTKQAEQIIYVFDGFIAEQTNDRINGITTHAIYGQGDLILSPFIEKLSNDKTSYLAITNSSYKTADAKHLFAVAEKSNPSSALLLKKVIHQLDIAYQRTENLSLKYSEDKIIFRLIFYANRFGKKDGESTVIQVPLTRHLLASSINISRERVTRILKKLETQNEIDYSGKKIIIKDLDHLKSRIDYSGL